MGKEKGFIDKFPSSMNHKPLFQFRPSVGWFLLLIFLRTNPRCGSFIFILTIFSLLNHLSFRTRSVIEKPLNNISRKSNMSFHSILKQFILFLRVYHERKTFSLSRILLPRDDIESLYSDLERYLQTSIILVFSYKMYFFLYAV